MPILILAACLLILNACSLHTPLHAPLGAGIIAVACKNNTAFYLLARERTDNRSGWSHLGGTHEGDEPLLATALREFNEESNCSFNLDDPHLLKLSGPSRSGNFYTYHMMIEYLPTSDIAESGLCQTDERDQWVWAKREDLFATLQKNTQPLLVNQATGEQQAILLWKAAADALRQAIIDKVIPEENPCIP